MKKQGGTFDNDLLKDQKERILKGFSAFDEEIDAMNNTKVDPNAGKSLTDLMKEKREANEKLLEHSKP